MSATFKDYVDGAVEEDENPFSIREMSKEDWDGDDEVTLNWYWKHNPFVELKVKSGFEVRMRISSDQYLLFNSVETAYYNQGYPAQRIQAYNTGIGGQSVIDVWMLGGDWFRIDTADSLLTIDLRKEVAIDAGSYQVTDGLGALKQDLYVEMIEVVKYTEQVGDVEGNTEATPEGEGTGDTTPFNPAADPRGSDQRKYKAVKPHGFGVDPVLNIGNTEMAAIGMIVGMGLVLWLATMMR